MPINSKQKGKNGELEIAKILREYGFSNVRRGVQYNGADGSSDIVGLPGIHPEIKRVEKLNIDEALEQATNDAINHGSFDIDGDWEEESKIPVVMHRKNKKMWKVTMYLEDWIKLYSAFIAPNLPTERENLTR